MQSIGGASRDSCSTVGSILHANLPTVRSPFEEGTIPTVFLRGYDQNAEVGRSGPHAYLSLPFTIFYWSWRFYAKYRHVRRYYHHYPHRHLRIILPVQCMGAPQESAVAIQDPHLASDILSDAEVSENLFPWSQAA